MKLPAFFKLPIIAPLPDGIVADRSAELGLLGFQQNANRYANEMASTATAGTAVSITAAQVVSGVVQLNTGASGAFTVDLPTTAALLAALGGTVKQDGTFTKIVSFVNNNVGQTGTLTAGDTPTSVIGTATIANDTRRDFAMRVLASSISFTNIGSVSL